MARQERIIIFRHRELNTLLSVKSSHTLSPGPGREFDVTAQTEYPTTINGAGRLPRVKRLLQWLALALAVAASALLLFLPVYSGVTSDSNGASTETSAAHAQPMEATPPQLAGSIDH